MCSWYYKLQNKAFPTVQVLAVNHLSENVSVVHSDAALLERGREVRPLGVNIVLADIFDAGQRLDYCQHFDERL